VVPFADGADQAALRLGKEDPERIADGADHATSALGPWWWIHGERVGEVLAAAALIDRLRALNCAFSADLGNGDVAAIVAKRFR